MTDNEPEEHTQTYGEAKAELYNKVQDLKLDILLVLRKAINDAIERNLQDRY